MERSKRNLAFLETNHSLNLYGFFSAGLTAKVIDRTKTMADVYGAFFDFSVMLKAKVEIFLSDSDCSLIAHRFSA